MLHCARAGICAVVGFAYWWPNPMITPLTNPQTNEMPKMMRITATQVGRRFVWLSGPTDEGTLGRS